MNRWLTLGAIVACFGVSAPVVAPANYDRFGIALLQRLASASKDQNVFVSPLSIGVALAMAADGAHGKTRGAILAALQQPGRQDLSNANAALIAQTLGNSDARIGLADALWLRANEPPAPAYVTLLKKKYRAEARAVDFGDARTVDKINAWVNAHTLGLIDDLLDGTTSGDFAILTNALAFQGKWEQPFQKNVTQPHSFTNADGSISQVPMMSQVGNFASIETSRFRALRMPYGHGSLAAYVILSRSNDEVAVLHELTARGLRRVVDGLRPRYLRVSMPRFTARLKKNLNEVLNALGMAIAFSPNADFTHMHEGGGIYIQNVEHASYVRVDEAGTTAAAATSVEFARLGVAVRTQPPPTFMVDHPFIFAIRNERAHSLLFIGVINHLP